MINKLPFILIITTLFYLPSIAQEVSNIQIDSLRYKVLPSSFKNQTFAGKDVDALTLSDKALSYVADSLALYFAHSSTIFINSEAGVDWSVIELPFSQEDSLIRVEAVRYRMTSSGIDSTSLPEKSITSRELNTNGKLVTVDFKDTQPGDIIQYSYAVKFEDWKNLNDWYFQNDIPALRSSYSVITPTNVFFYKELQGLKNLDNFSRKGYVQQIGGQKKEFLYEYFEMKNVAAYEYEHDVPSEEYFISKLRFHLSEYTIPGKEPVFLLPASYEELSVNWASDPYFSQINSKSIYLNNLINKLYYREFDDKRNAQSFYYFVRNNFTIDNSYQDKSLQEVFKDQRGTAQQINILLAKILNQAGLEANMVALCTFSNQPIYPEFPHFELFDHFVVLLRTPNENYFLDASARNALFGMLPPARRAFSGLVISKYAPGFIDIPYIHKDEEHSIVNIQITDSAFQHLKSEVRRKGFNVFAFDEEYLSGNKTYNDYYIETIFKNPSWDDIEHEIKGELSGFKELEEDLSFTSRIEEVKNNNYMEVPSIFFNEFEQNPLSDSSRQNPLTIYAPIERIATYNYKIPEGWMVQKLPESKSIKIKDDSATFAYKVEENDGSVKISFRLYINKTIFMPKEYADLQEFYSIIVDLTNQNIILIKP